MRLVGNGCVVFFFPSRRRHTRLQVDWSSDVCSSDLAVGYIGFDGRLDTCIAIRTAVIADGVCRIQAGAGIVADSDPAAEELETRTKARALLRAIELVDGGEARP